MSSEPQLLRLWSRSAGGEDEKTTDVGTGRGGGGWRARPADERTEGS